jgi:flagellin
LSSGLRINSAKDDAAGLAISTRFESQIRGTGVAIRNAGDGISLAQTGEGSLSNITTSLQRMRELALQSANGSNTDLERSSIQEEVDQLKEEIKTISANTNFNGRNLLDGSFQKVSFQTGANVGETIEVSIAKTTEATLGTAVANGISSSTTTGTLAAGDITINGISVGAADASADGASKTNPQLSAITVAAAINKVADASGVDAVVNANFAGGTTVAATSITNSPATVTINGKGITLAGSGAAANKVADLQGVADTINLSQGETGVRAVFDSNNLDAGVSLVADDGRNITIAGAAAGSFGLKTAGTYTGTYTLVSRDGSDITIGSATGKSQENAGLEIGTYSGTNSGVNGGEVTGAITAGDLTINGVSVGPSLASYDTGSYTSKEGSAISIAKAVNLVSDKTGVTASTQATQLTSGDITAVGAVSGLLINNVTINAASADSGATTSEQVSLVVEAINNKQAQTGVRAEVVDDNQYQLVADDGRNITVGGTVTGSGLSAATTRGSVTLSGAGQITIGRANSTGPAKSGFTEGVYGGGEAGVLIKDISVLTVADAEKAIKGIDNALNQVSKASAQLGAIQNRFDSTIQNLSTKSENLSAANSRIRDADFASETAALSKAQVLQQAGISILAQANARPQQVLSLLQ